MKAKICKKCLTTPCLFDIMNTDKARGNKRKGDYMIKVYKCWTPMDENGHSEETLTLELWNASTKYPDSKFYFSDFQKSPWVKEEYQIFQWLLECASKLNFPFFAKELTEYALANWVNWEDKK